MQYTSKTGPDTKIVLGGLCQGAGVMDLIIMAAWPVADFVPAPMPPEVAAHAAPAAVFENLARNLAGAGLQIAISPLYGSKTIHLCAPDAIFCSTGKSLTAHFSYFENEMVDQAASFAASRL